MRPETMIVDTDNGPVMINKSEFDSNVHRVAGGAEPVQPIPATQPAAPLGFDTNGNPVNAGDGGQQQPVPAASTNEYLVTKSADGKKFIVVDKNALPVDREGIDPKGYKQEDDAWAAVKAL